jgi:hypothetical protein
MSDEEGATPFDTMRDIVPVQLTPATGKGALDTWRSPTRSGTRTQSRGSIHSRGGDEDASKPAKGRADARQRLNLAGAGKAREGKPRSEPDSGKPTVRDRRGASGNVAMVEM